MMLHDFLDHASIGQILQMLIVADCIQVLLFLILGGFGSLLWNMGIKPAIERIVDDRATAIAHTKMVQHQGNGTHRVPTGPPTFDYEPPSWADALDPTDAETRRL